MKTLIALLILAAASTPSVDQKSPTAAAPAADAQSPAIISSEFINEHAPYPSCHASTIAEVAPGKLVAAWFGGTAERNPDVGIWVARQENGKWLDGVEVANGIQADGSPRLPTWNPALFQAPKGGPLVLFYKVGPSPAQWWGMIMFSNDAGKTWSKPQRLPDGILGAIKDKAVSLPDGSWMSPSSSEKTSDHRLYFEITHDQGKTWQSIGPVDRGNKNLNAIQPTVLFYHDGRMQALSRTSNGVIAETWSKDNGKSWSPLVPTSLPNNNSGIDAVTLADGRQLLVYNNAGPDPNNTTAGKGNRYPLDVALSTDGENWKHVLTIESKPLGNGYAYPAVIQTSDGLVHITYTWDRKHIKHVVLDPKKL